MNNKLFLVYVAYNGNRPRVSISISWRRFFNGVWQSVKNTFNSVMNFMQMQLKRGNVYALSLYALVVALCEVMMIVYCINGLKAVNADVDVFLQELWGEWTAFLGEFGIVAQAHQIGMLIIAIALFAVITAPAVEWNKFFTTVYNNRQMTSAEKWNALIQQADGMVVKYNALITGTCGWILKIAGATAIVWMIWTMLQG